MKRILKIGALVYFAIAFPILFIVANFFILKPNPEIYSFIPQDADIVIELNAKNFIKEIVYQRLYNEDYFLRKMPVTDDESILEDPPINTGINFFSQIIIFREAWAEEEIWYSVLKIESKSDFEAYLVANEFSFKKEYNSNYVVVQLTSSTNEDAVTEHLIKLAKKSVKSFDAKIDLSETFLTENEINVYLAPKNSKHIISGELFLNFLSDKIIVKGNFTPISQSEKIPYTAYISDEDKAFSLRSSLNLFNSIYLFHDQTLDNLPEYSQLSMDFDGTKLVMSDDVIPLVAYPQLNLKFDIPNSTIWTEYLEELNSNDNIIVDSLQHKISLNSEAKSRINYNLTDSEFSLFQNSNHFDNTVESKNYLSIHIQPELFVTNTTFEEDSLNPPSLISRIKIDIFQSILEEMEYWNQINHIDFTIYDDKNNVDFVSDGIILFNEKSGHSMIESLVILQNTLGTVGTLLEE